MNKDLLEAIENLSKLYLARKKYKTLLNYLEDIANSGDEGSYPFAPSELIEELKERYGEFDNTKDFYPVPPLPLNEYPEIHKIISWKSEE